MAKGAEPPASGSDGAPIQVALFDLDRTLIDVNSGGLWLRNEWRDGRIGIRDAAWASWWLFRYSLGQEDGLDQVFATAVRTLAGSSEAALSERVREWFEREVQHRLRPGAARAMADHRAAGHELVLATSSTAYVARCAAAAYGLDDIVATTLAVDGDLFTGEIAELAVGASKATAVRRWADRRGLPLARCAFYTDSHTDLALLEEVGQPMVVHPDRLLAAEAARRGWPVIDWGRAA